MSDIYSETVCIQIGNTDDKLSQKEWSEFWIQTHDACKLRGKIHFAGGPPSMAAWQNGCFVVELFSDDNKALLKNDVLGIRQKFRQESAAWLEGVTTFV